MGEKWTVAAVVFVVVEAGVEVEVLFVAVEDSAYRMSLVLPVLPVPLLAWTNPESSMTGMALSSL